MRFFNRLFNRLKNFFRNLSNRLVKTLRGRPLVSFFSVLILLFLLILLGNTLFKAKTAPTPQPPQVKSVKTYSIGKIPTIRVSAQVKKDGVITIMAQSPGVVQKVSVKEGDEVKKGTSLVSLSSNYQGGNTPSLQRQLAKLQYDNIVDTYNTQKDIIAKQRDLALKNADNTEQLRLISEKTTGDTNSLLDLNKDIVSSIETDLQNLIDTNANGQNDALILQTKQLKSSFQSAVTNLQAQVRNMDYAKNTDNPPTKIAITTKDMAIEQLEIQEKALNLSKETAKVQLNLASVNESLMFPVSPSTGTVQKVFVHPGQSVTPGTPLLTIYAPTGKVTAIAKLPQNLASQVSRLENSSLYIKDQILTETPSFISSEATDGQLYSINFDIPEDYHKNLTDQSFIDMDIPIGHSDSNVTVPFIPLDAVFQTQDQTFVYVVNNGTAQSKTIKLGQVLGSDVEVKEGLKDGDQIILNRNVIAGDKVTAS